MTCQIVLQIIRVLLVFYEWNYSRPVLGIT